MPKNVGGYVGDREHDTLVSEITEWERQKFLQLTPTYNKMRQFHALYLADRPDRRLPNEKWRSWSFVPEPFEIEESKTAALMEVMGAIDPPIQAEGVGREDAQRARGFERTMDYVLRGNRWDYTREMLLRTMGIQGWAVVKPGWRDIVWKTTRRPSREEKVAFDLALNEAINLGVPAPPDPESQPDEFRVWHESARRIYPQLPNVPGLGVRETVQYRGPWFFRPSEFDLRFDPFVEDWSEMDMVIHRIVKPWKWVEEQVKAGRYDGKQVAAAKPSTLDRNIISKWDEEIAQKIGLTFDANDPLYKDAAELWEVWRPRDEKAPYLVILNRKAIVNLSTDHPYWHRQLPFVPLRNIPLGRRATGMSDYFQLERSFSDRNTFRDLLLDALVLSVMPVFLKQRNLGLSDASKLITPGMIQEVSDVNGWRRGWEAPPGFAELMRVGEMLRSDQENALSMWGNVKGTQANIGRVSATESQARLQQALVRVKRAAVRLEEEHNPIIPQSLMLIYQKWPEDDANLSELRRRVVGEDGQDPFAGMTREDFSESLSMDIKFRGATRTLNKELEAQQLKDFLVTASQIQAAPGVSAITPSEIRAILRRIFETQGQKGINELVTPEGDALLDRAYEQVKINVETALLTSQQGLQAAQQPPQPEAPPQPPPPEIPYRDAPEDVRRQLEGQAGLQPSQMGGPMTEVTR